MSLENYEFAKLRQDLILETKQKIASSIGPDFMVTQAMNAISDIDKIANTLSKRLQEWFGLYNPEAIHNVSYEHFVGVILETVAKGEMGGEFAESDIGMMKGFAERLADLVQEKQTLTDYIKTKMQGFAPHVLEITGPLIGGKLISHKGTLRELAFMPASTIQILGAEKALFRHLRSHAKSPKYGYILQHQEVAKAENKGKAARQLANRISKAAKQDYFSK